MNKLCLNSRDELLMLDLDALAYLQANGNYTQVMYIASKGPLVSLGLSKLEAYIREPKFSGADFGDIAETCPQRQCGPYTCAFGAEAAIEAVQRHS